MNTDSTLDFASWSKEDLEILQEQRENINNIDEKLLTLLNARADASFAIGALKKKVSKDAKIFDAKREKELLERLYALNAKEGGTLSEKHIHAIWNEILSASRSLQETL